MIASGLDVLLAFPREDGKRSGTSNCMARAEQAGIRVVTPDRWEATGLPVEQGVG